VLIIAWHSKEFTVDFQNRGISRPFIQGMFDGFWYSFITASTVGYGDKVVT
jgi:hypothetical protein